MSFTDLANTRARSQRQVAQAALARLGSRRGQGAPVRRAFVLRADGGGPSPLALLLSSSSNGGGGRGGRTRLVLLLSLLWTSVAPPYDTRRTARWWASLLGVPGDAHNAARLIRDTFADLERRGFIRVDRTVREEPVTFLLDERGTRKPYTRPDPHQASEGSEAADSTGYFRIPDLFWTDGYCVDLSAPAIAMYLISLYGDQTASFWFAEAAFRDRYGLSDSTRKKGLRELVEVGILDEDTRTIDIEGALMGRTRARKVYQLPPAFRSPNVTT